MDVSAFHIDPVEVDDDEDDVDIQILTKGTATVTSNQINIVLRLGSNAIQNIE